MTSPVRSRFSFYFPAFAPAHHRIISSKSFFKKSVPLTPLVWKKSWHDRAISLFQDHGRGTVHHFASATLAWPTHALSSLRPLADRDPCRQLVTLGRCYTRRQRIKCATESTDFTYKASACATCSSSSHCEPRANRDSGRRNLCNLANPPRSSP